jgi:hypothetical protein
MAYEVVHLEHAMTDVAAGYGGTIDIVFRRRSDGVIIVADLKTGKGIYDETVVQLGAYSLLIRNVAGMSPPIEGLIIHDPVGDEPMRVVPISSEMLTLGAQAFASLLFVYQSRKSFALPKEPAHAR